MYVDHRGIEFEILGMKVLKVLVGVMENSLWVLEKSLKFVFE